MIEYEENKNLKPYYKITASCVAQVFGGMSLKLRGQTLEALKPYYAIL
jgi:hypothetical protein